MNNPPLPPVKPFRPAATTPPKGLRSIGRLVAGQGRRAQAPAPHQTSTGQSTRLG